MRSEEQIIGILREHEAGAKWVGLYCKHGTSEDTLQAQNAKSSVMRVSEVERLKALGNGNARLKRQLPEMVAMKELLSKKMVTPAVNRGPSRIRKPCSGCRSGERAGFARDLG